MPVPDACDYLTTLGGHFFIPHRWASAELIVAAQALLTLAATRGVKNSDQGGS